MNCVKTRRFGLALAVVLMSSSMMLLAQSSALAAEASPAQFSYSSKGKMSSYRNLAQVAYSLYLKGDDDDAAMVARTIEDLYDKNEGGLEKSSPALHGRIDMAMDGFIKPLKYHVKAGRPDPEKEKAAFENYLKCLALAD